MSYQALEARVAALEEEVRELKARLARHDERRARSWFKDAGRFANDPDFDEMVRLGREYRDSLRPADDGPLDAGT